MPLFGVLLLVAQVACAVHAGRTGRPFFWIYLILFLPMAGTRTLMLKYQPIVDIGTISLLVTVAGVIGALVLWWLVRGTRASFLFERPTRLWIAPPRRLALQPAQ